MVDAMEAMRIEPTQLAAFIDEGQVAVPRGVL